MDIDAYESAEAEALLRAAQVRPGRRTPLGHEILVHGVTVGGFLAGAVCLAVFVPWERSLSIPVLVMLTGIYVVAACVRFPVGSVWANPTQLAFVPMLFLLPTPLVPAVVAAALVLTRTPAFVRGRIPLPRLVALLGDCWYSLGPAVVLVAAGGHGFAWSRWPVYVAAFAAQVAVDAAVMLFRLSVVERISPRDQLPTMVWTFGVDSALSTVGVLIAASAVTRPGLALLALPMIGLLGLFARERHERLDQVLTLSSAYRGTALLLADVVEADDHYTGEHSRGVLELSLGVSDALGLDASQRRVVEFAALLHDVGKIRVPKTIITKRGPLDEDEWMVIRRHTIDGEAMLCQVGGALIEVGRIVRASHERYDGQGYPDGLVGEEIPLEARIVSACDSYSAMTTDRSYRKGRSPGDALAELERCSGSQFDPHVVATLSDLVRAELREPTAGLAARS